MSIMPRGWRSASTALAAALLLFGCGSTTAQAPVPVQRLSVKLADASTNFGVNLLDQLLAGADDNVFVSPLSAEIALAMAASAADGDTRARMLQVLGLDPATDPSAELRTTIQRLNQSDPNAQLELAQAVWVQNALKLDPAYEKLLRTDYQSQLANLNFNDPNAPSAVNRWVDSKTHHLIPTLVDHFDPGTVGYLANAVYFHALWATEFKTTTDPIEFHSFSGQTRQVPGMEAKNGMTVASDDKTYSAILVPYKGGRFSAVILEPLVSTPAAIASFLTAPLWLDVMAKLHTALGPLLAGPCKGSGCDATLQMPKFTIDYHKDVTGALVKLGFPIPGDVPKFCASCFVSGVAQATHLQVDEHGTTAAAATGVAVATSLELMVVNRPFVFAIVDNATDAPLFLGAIGNLG